MQEETRSMELVIPTGELVPLAEPARIAQALDSLRQLETQIRMAKAELTDALLEHSKELGSKTLTFSDGHKAIIRGGTETVYDAEMIIEELRAEGMPETRISEIVVETVTYKVNAVEAKRAAAANPAYAEVIARNSRQQDRRITVEIK